MPHGGGGCKHRVSEETTEAWSGQPRSQGHTAGEQQRLLEAQVWARPGHQDVLLVEGTGARGWSTHPWELASPNDGLHLSQARGVRLACLPPSVLLDPNDSSFSWCLPWGWMCLHTLPACKSKLDFAVGPHVSIGSVIGLIAGSFLRTQMRASVTVPHSLVRILSPSALEYYCREHFLHSQ